MRKLATIAFSFFAAIFVYQNIMPSVWLLGAAAAVLLLGILFMKEPWRARTTLAAIGLAAGFLWSFFYDGVFIVPAKSLDGAEMEITAEVADFPRATEYGIYVEVRIRTKHPVTLPALLKMDPEYAYLSPGDSVTLTAELSFADTIYGEKTDYYISDGIFLKAYQNGSAAVIPAESISLKYVPAYMAEAVRAKIGEIFPENAAGFIAAILTGDTSAISDDFHHALRYSGAAHIVAVSGMHVTFLVSLLASLLGKKRRGALISIPVILLFMAFTGGAPSVVRAGVMQIFILTAPLLRREADTLTSLGASLLLLLLSNPYSASDIGLQLSFAAVVGLAYISAPINAKLIGKIPDKPIFRTGVAKAALKFLVTGISSSIGVTVVTTPIVAAAFDYISLLSPVTNLLILWIVSLIFAGAIVACIAGFIFTPLGAAAGWIIARGVYYVEAVCGLVASLPFSVLYTLNAYIRIWLVSIYIIFTPFSLAKGKKRPVIPVALSALLLCLCILLGTAESDRGSLTVTALDVGQGQSIVLGTTGYTVLVDCGGSSARTAGEAAAKYLFSQNIYHLDVLMLTHFDKDHVNGVPTLLRILRTDRILVPPEVEEGTEELREDILSLAESLDIEVVEIASNTVFNFGRNVLRVYAPMGKGSTNGAGISALYTSGDFDVLITGDMDTVSERILLAAAELPDIELLVAGHHGSKSSTSERLLNTLLPEIAFISVGSNNMYGHPAAETIERLLHYSVAVYQTDIYGNITVKVE